MFWKKTFHTQHKEESQPAEREAVREKKYGNHTRDELAQSENWKKKKKKKKGTETIGKSTPGQLRRKGNDTAGSTLAKKNETLKDRKSGDDDK